MLVTVGGEDDCHVTLLTTVAFLTGSGSELLQIACFLLPQALCQLRLLLQSLL